MASIVCNSPLYVDTELGEPFDVGGRFTDFRPIGYGTNGPVFAATDTDCDKKVSFILTQPYSYTSMICV